MFMLKPGQQLHIPKGCLHMFHKAGPRTFAYLKECFEGKDDSDPQWLRLRRELGGLYDDVMNACAGTLPPIQIFPSKALDW